MIVQVLTEAGTVVFQGAPADVLDVLEIINPMDGPRRLKCDLPELSVWLKLHYCAPRSEWELDG